MPGYVPRVVRYVAHVRSGVCAPREALTRYSARGSALFGAWERAIRRAVPCCVRPCRSSPRPLRRSFPFVRVVHWQLTLPVELVF